MILRYLAPHLISVFFFKFLKMVPLNLCELPFVGTRVRSGADISMCKPRSVRTSLHVTDFPSTINGIVKN